MNGTAWASSAVRTCHWTAVPRAGKRRDEASKPPHLASSERARIGIQCTCWCFDFTLLFYDSVAAGKLVAGARILRAWTVEVLTWSVASNYNIHNIMVNYFEEMA